MKVYAVHASGKKLWYPTADALACSTVPRSEIAAITINEQGVTFPPGTFYLRGTDGRPKAGWTRVIDLPKNTKNGHILMPQESQTTAGRRKMPEPGNISALSGVGETCH